MPPGVSKGRVLLAASGAVAVALIGLALALIRWGDDSPAGQVKPPTFLTASRSSDVAVLELATGRIRLVTRRDGQYLAVSSPTWSPDGRGLAFAQQACPHCPFRIAVVDGAASRRATLISGPGRDLNEPSWAPAGDRLAVTRSEHAERALALLDLRGRLNIVDLHEEEGAEEEGEEVEAPNHPAFSPDGGTLAFDAETARERTAVFLLDVASEEVHAIESEADHYAYPSFSPDGRRLAFSRTDAVFAWDVCVAPLSGRDQVCLTRGSANDTEPTWSPDGGSIVFASDREDPKVGLRSLYVVNVDGSGLRRLTRGFDDGAAAFSPDGTEVAFVRRQIVRVER